MKNVFTYLKRSMISLHFKDNDGDGEIDEDLAKPFEEFNATSTSTTTLPTRTTPSYIKSEFCDNYKMI